MLIILAFSYVQELKPIKSRVIVARMQLQHASKDRDDDMRNRSSTKPKAGDWHTLTCVTLNRKM